jgi:hypothetical protein
LTELNANVARASDCPPESIRSNWISCPGRASCAVSVHVTASCVKSSERSVPLPPGAGGTSSGSTNSPTCPVFPTSGAGFMCAAGVSALSASEATRMRAGRSGSVTKFSRRTIASISSSRAR